LTFDFSRETTEVVPLEIGLCSWSIDREDVVRAMHVAASQFNVRVVQIGFFGQSALDHAQADTIRVAASEAGVEVSAAFVGFDGEDYTSIESIRRTGGFLPFEHFKERLLLAGRAAALASSLSLDKLGLHVGPIPNDSSDPRYATLLERVRRVADSLGHYGVMLMVETGAETAETLHRFINELGREHVGVNFDSGNFITYGTGDPVRAVTILSERIKHVHLKDYAPSASPGVEWGSETPLGAGQADIPRLVSKLRARGYRGPLILERRVRDGDLQPIREDLHYLRSIAGD